MTIGRTALKRIGRTPEERVRWVLAFVRRDPARLSPRARQVAADSLYTRLRRPAAPWPEPEALKTLHETHRALERCVEDLANGNPTRVRVPEMVWQLNPPARRPTGSRHSAPVRRFSVELTLEPGFTPPQVVLAFVDDLNAIGADRLRACPLERGGTRCGVVFLGTRGQRYCTPRHTQAAAWQAYLDRGGDVTRKLRRKG